MLCKEVLVWIEYTRQAWGFDPAEKQQRSKNVIFNCTTTNGEESMRCRRYKHIYLTKI